MRYQYIVLNAINCNVILLLLIYENRISIYKNKWSLILQTAVFILMVVTVIIMVKYCILQQLLNYGKSLHIFTIIEKNICLTFIINRFCVLCGQAPLLPLLFYSLYCVFFLKQCRLYHPVICLPYFSGQICIPDFRISVFMLPFLLFSKDICGAFSLLVPTKYSTNISLL